MNFTIEIDGIGEFEAVIAETAASVPADLGKFRKKVASRLYRGVLRRSPRDTGYFASNWHLSKGQVDETVNAPGGKFYPAPDEAAEIARLDGLGAEEDAFLSNGTDYGVYLEDGHSDQAPLGIVSVTFLEEITIINSIENLDEYLRLN